MGRSGVTVLGSANLDLMLRMQALPSAGQTVISAPRVDGPGGKGLNQAVAAARAGAPTRFIAAVGDDPAAAVLRQVLADDGIEPLVRTTSTPTGLAVVMVDAAGENAIVVEPGANAELVGLTPPELAAIAAARVLLMQLEVPTRVVAEAARQARDAGTKVVLNAAPPPAVLDAALVECIDVLVVNAGEARSLGGEGDPERQIDRLLERVPAVVVTLGPDGALYRDRDGARNEEAGRSVVVTDTTAAGDTFVGYLAAGMAEGVPMPVALRRANAAAALCVQRPGAVPSVPWRDEVDAASGA